MVATIISNDLGLFNSQNAGTGQSQFGQGNERVYINASDGNLILQRQDQVLVGTGLDTPIVRTYNSLGRFNDDNGDNFRFSFHQRLINRPAVIDGPGSTITRVSGDGHETLFVFDETLGYYISTDGQGAHDSLQFNNGEWIWTEGSSRLQEVYDNDGRLIQARDREGRVTQFHYAANGLVNQITDASGQIISIVYDQQFPDRVMEINTGAGSQELFSVRSQTQVRYKYNNNGQLKTVQLDLTPDITTDHVYYQTSYQYDAQNRLTDISQTDGSQVTFAYDSQNRISRVTQGSGDEERITRYDYELNKTHITEIVDGGTDTGYRSTLIYDDEKHLKQFITPPNRQGQRLVTSYSYDADGNILSIRDARNHTRYFEYDDNGNQTKATDTLGNIIERRYTAENQLAIEIIRPQVIDNIQNNSDIIINRFVYDEQHRLRFQIEGNGAVTETRYDDIAENTLSVLRYGANRFPMAAFTENQIPSLIQLKSAVNSLSAEDKQAIERVDTFFDFREQISRVISYARTDDNGKGITDGTESISHYVYDQYGQLLKTVDARGENPNNDLSHEATAFETDYRYDGMGRLLSVFKALDEEATTVYEYTGNRIHVTEKNGLRTTSVFNTAGELIETLQVDHSNILNDIELAKTTFHYDEQGQLRSTINPVNGQSHQLYDQLGRLMASIDETGTMTELFYNNNAQVYKTLVYADRVTAEALNGLQQKAETGIYADSDPITLLDNIRPVSQETDRTSYSVYDTEGRVAYTVDGEGYISQMLYDAADRLVSSAAFGLFQQDQEQLTTAITVSVTSAEQGDGSWSQSNTGPSHMAGLLGLMADDIVAEGLSPEVLLDTAQVQRFFYDEAGLLMGELDAEGFMTRHTYDHAGDRIQTRHYSRDDNTDVLLNFTGTLEELTPATHQEDDNSYFLYNKKNQLQASVTQQGFVVSYQYDKAGNLIAQTEYAQSLTRGELNEIITAIDGDISRAVLETSRSNGGILPIANAQEDRKTVWVYNALNQVETVTDYLGAVTSYSYDAMNRVTETTVGVGSTDARTSTMDYDLQSRIISEQNALALAQNVAITHAYDEAGRRISSTDVNGNKTIFYYDAANRLRFSVVVTDKDNQLGEVTEFVFNALGQQEEVREYTERIDIRDLVGGVISNTLLDQLSNSPAPAPAPAGMQLGDSLYKLLEDNEYDAGTAGGTVHKILSDGRTIRFWIETNPTYTEHTFVTRVYASDNLNQYTETRESVDNRSDFTQRSGKNTVELNDNKILFNWFSRINGKYTSFARIITLDNSGAVTDNQFVDITEAGGGIPNVSSELDYYDQFTQLSNGNIVLFWRDYTDEYFILLDNNGNIIKNISNIDPNHQIDYWGSVDVLADESGGFSITHGGGEYETLLRTLRYDDMGHLLEETNTNVQDFIIRFHGEKLLLNDGFLIVYHEFGLLKAKKFSSDGLLVSEFNINKASEGSANGSDAYLEFIKVSGGYLIAYTYGDVVRNPNNLGISFIDDTGVLIGDEMTIDASIDGFEPYSLFSDLSFDQTSDNRVFLAYGFIGKSSGGVPSKQHYVRQEIIVAGDGQGPSDVFDIDIINTHQHPAGPEWIDNRFIKTQILDDGRLVEIWENSGSNEGPVGEPGPQGPNGPTRPYFIRLYDPVLGLVVEDQIDLDTIIDGVNSIHISPLSTDEFLLYWSASDTYYGRAQTLMSQSLRLNSNGAELLGVATSINDTVNFDKEIGNYQVTLLANGSRLLSWFATVGNGEGPEGSHILLTDFVGTPLSDVITLDNINARIKNILPDSQGGFTALLMDTDNPNDDLIRMQFDINAVLVDSTTLPFPDEQSRSQALTELSAGLYHVYHDESVGQLVGSLIPLDGSPPIDSMLTDKIRWFYSEDMTRVRIEEGLLVAYKTPSQEQAMHLRFINQNGEVTGQEIPLDIPSAIFDIYIPQLSQLPNGDIYLTYYQQNYNTGDINLIKQKLDLSFTTAPTNNSYTATKFQYDEKGNLIQQTDAENYKTQFEYDAFSNTIKHLQDIDKEGGQTISEFTYDKRQQQTSTTQFTNTETAITIPITTNTQYDAFGRVTQFADGRGHTTTSTYTDNGRTIQTQDAHGEKRTTEYNIFGQVVQEKNARGVNTRYAYDNQNRTLSTEIQLQGAGKIKTTVTSNLHGEQIEITDGNGSITQYFYDSNGNVIRMVNPEGEETLSRFDAAHLLTESTDPEGTLIRYEYDGANRLLKQTLDPDGLAIVTEFEYDAKGQQITTIERNTVENVNLDRITAYRYDTVGNTTQVIVDPDGLGLLTEYTYDGLRNQLIVAEGSLQADEKTLLRQTQYAYDDAGRRIKEIRVNAEAGDEVTEFVYDENNHVITRLNPNGSESHFIHDALNRPVYQIDPAGAVSQTLYDEEGNVVQTIAFAQTLSVADIALLQSGDDSVLDKTNLANQTTYALYDNLNRQTFFIDAEGYVTAYQYDNNHNQVEIVRTGQAINPEEVLFNKKGKKINSQRAQRLFERFQARNDDVRSMRNVFDQANRVRFTLELNSEGLYDHIVKYDYNQRGDVMTTTQFAVTISPYKKDFEWTEAYVERAVSLAQTSQQSNPQQGSTFYDAVGRVTDSIDAVGYQEHYVLDDLGNRLALHEFVHTPSGVRDAVAIAADSNPYVGGAPTDVGVWRYSYDRAGRLVGELTPEVEVSEARWQQMDISTGETGDSGAIKRLGKDGLGLYITTNGLPTPFPFHETKYVYDPKISKVTITNNVTNEIAKVYAFSYGLVDSPTVLHLGDLAFLPAGHYSATLHQQGEFYLVGEYKEGEPETYNYYQTGADATTFVIGEGSITTLNWSLPDTVSQVNLAYRRLDPSNPNADFQHSGPLLPDNNNRYQFAEYLGDHRYEFQLTYTDENNQNQMITGTFNTAESTADLVGLGLSSATSTTALETRISYTALGNVHTRTEAANTASARTSIYVYDALGRQFVSHLPGETDISQLTRYNNAGEAVASRNERSFYSYKVYDERGLLKYAIDEESYVTEHRYDAFGNQQQLIRYANAIDSSGHTTGQQWTVEEVQAQLTPSADDRTLTYHYDHRNQQTRIEQDTVEVLDENIDTQAVMADTPTVENIYNGFGELIEQRSYVATSNNVSITNAQYLTNYFEYNAHGDQIKQVDALGYETFYTYDQFHNMSSRLEMASTDDSASDKNRLMVYEYDQLNRVTKESQQNVQYHQGVFDIAQLQYTINAVTDPLETQYTYDAHGNVILTEEANGNKVRTFYDVMGRTKAIITSGMALSFADQQSGIKTQQAISFQQDAYGNVVQQTQHAKAAAFSDWDSPDAIVVLPTAQSDDKVERYFYNKTGLRSGLINGENQLTRIDYDEAGNMIKESFLLESHGEIKEVAHYYDYDKTGRQTATRITYEMDDKGNALQSTLKSEYNAFGEVARRGDGANIYEFFTYDKAGRLINSNEGDGRYKFYGYDLLGQNTFMAQNTSTARNIEGETSLNNLLNNLNWWDENLVQSQLEFTINTLDVGGRTIQQRQNSFDHDDGSGTVFTPTQIQGYDRWGNVTQLQNGNGGIITREYDHNDQVIAEIKQAMDYEEYDEVNGLVAKTENVETLFYYDVHGELINTRDARGHDWKTLRNENGLMLGQATGMGESEFRLYDVDIFGRQVQQHYASDVLHNSGRRIVSRYDRNDQLIEQQTGFDSEGNPLQTVQYQYDEAGNRTHESIVMEAGELRTTETVYNLRGDVVDMRLPGAVKGSWESITATVYDSYGNKTRMTQGNGHSEQWFFDSSNNAYFHRADRYTDQGDHDFVYEYHQVNRRLLLETATSRNTHNDDVQTGTKTTTYDEIGQLVKVAFDYAAGRYTKTETRRDERGNLVYDATEQKNAGSSGQYDQSGDYSYDAFDRLVQVSDSRKFESETAIPMTLAYTYDQMDNRRSVISTIQGEADKALYYTYDQANRLTLTQGFLDTDTNRIVINIHQGKEVAYDLDGNRRYVKAYADVRGEDMDQRVQLRQKVDGVLEYVWVTIDNAETWKRRLTYEFYDYTANGLVSDMWKVAVEASDAEATPEQLHMELTENNNHFIHRDYNAAGQEIQQTVVTVAVGESSRTREIRSMTYNDTGWLIDQKTETRKDGELIKTENVQYHHDGAGNVMWYAYDQQGDDDGLDIISHITYAYFNMAKERIKGVNAIDNLATRGNIYYTYDAWGNLMRFRDDQADFDNVHYYNASGVILTRIEEDGGIQHNVYSDGKSIAKAVKANKNTYRWETDIDFNFAQINDQYPRSSPGHYVINPGDTLATISLTVYGDSSLWYLIADANGLSNSAELVPGTGLRIPNQVSNFHNTSDTFAPYNPADVIGETAPSLLAPAPITIDQDGGCTMLKTVIVVVIIAVVAHYAKEALGPVVAWAGQFAPFLAAAGGAAAGSIVGQLAGIALGIREDFSWNDVGIAALTAGITAGAEQAIGVLSETFTSLDTVVQTMLSNALAQGIGIAFGIQDKFSWGQIAASGVAASIDAQGVDLSGNFFERTVMNTGLGLLTGVISEGVDTAVDGKGTIDFTRIASNAFGQAIGNSIVYEMQNSKADDEKNTKDINDFLAKKNQESINQFENQLNGNNPTSNPLDPRSHFAPEQLARMKELDSTLTEEDIAAEQKGLAGVSSPIVISKDGRVAKTGGPNEDRFLHTYLNKNGDEVRLRLDELLLSYIQGEENAFGDGFIEFGKTAELFIEQGREFDLSPIQRSLLLEDIDVHRNIVEGSGAESLSIAGRFVAFGQVGNIGFTAGKQINKSIVQRGNDQAIRTQSLNHQIRSKSLQHTVSNSTPLKLSDLRALKGMGLSKVGRRAIVEGFDLGLGLSRIRQGNPNSLLDFANANDAKIYGLYGKGQEIRLFDDVMPEYGTLERNLNFIFEKSNNIKFNLDGINNIPEAVRLGRNGIGYKYDINGLPTSNVTNWELNRIFNDQNLLNKTIFYRNGQQVEVPKL